MDHPTRYYVHVRTYVHRSICVETSKELKKVVGLPLQARECIYGRVLDSVAPSSVTLRGNLEEKWNSKL